MGDHLGEDRLRRAVQRKAVVLGCPDGALAQILKIHGDKGDGAQEEHIVQNGLHGLEGPLLQKWNAEHQHALAVGEIVRSTLR